MKATDYYGYFYLAALLTGVVVCEEQYCDARDASCNDNQVHEKLRNKMVVGAIDFGTTYSGWAYQFKHQYRKDPLNIKTSKWAYNDILSKKTPTTVLIKPDGKTLEAFGYDAEIRYLALTADEEHHDYYYFKRFKMMLYNIEDLNRETKIVDDKGLELSATTVFSLAIEFLKDNLIEDLQKMDQSWNMDNIYWVLTVPAIWKDKAKQFMRTSAVAAGILTDDLTIALEPEAASLYCRLLPVEKHENEKRIAFVDTFQPGRKYMVLDAGGGTVDITVHEVMAGRKLKELYKASGGPWGGTKVDAAFQDMLKTIIGDAMFELFKKECAHDHLDLLRSFESIKRTITPDKIDKYSFHSIQCLDTLLIKRLGKGLDRLVASSIYKDEIKFKWGKMIISADIGRSFFKDVISSIITAVNKLLVEDKVRGTGALLLVGGFSDSPMLQYAVRAAFDDMLQVFTPKDAELAVVKGAVNFGFFPGSISERVARYTFGIEIVTDFIEGKHDPAKRLRIEDRDCCIECFDRHVKIGTPIEYGSVQGHRVYTPRYEHQNNVDCKVVACETEEPVYVTDEGCTIIGRMTLSITNKGMSRYQNKFIVDFMFGDTEIKVSFTEVSTDKKRELFLDFN